MSEWIRIEDELPVLLPNTWRTDLPVNVIIDGFGQYLCYPCQHGNGIFYWADAIYYGDRVMRDFRTIEYLEKLQKVHSRLINKHWSKVKALRGELGLLNGTD